VLRARASALWIFARLSANAERFHPRYPHWNLETLASGTSRRAAESAAGLPCYLTTAEQENLAFYERPGFEVADDALPLVPT